MRKRLLFRTEKRKIRVGNRRIRIRIAAAGYLDMKELFLFFFFILDLRKQRKRRRVRDFGRIGNQVFQVKRQVLPVQIIRVRCIPIGVVLRFSAVACLFPGHVDRHSLLGIVGYSKLALPFVTANNVFNGI